MKNYTRRDFIADVRKLKPCAEGLKLLTKAKGTLAEIANQFNADQRELNLNRRTRCGRHAVRDILMHVGVSTANYPTLPLLPNHDRIVRRERALVWLKARIQFQDVKGVSRVVYKHLACALAFNGL